MKNLRLVMIFAAALVAGASAFAQPTRRVQEQQQQSQGAVTLSNRARTQYTAQTATPSEVSWKRDIYRELDLKKEKNAALYYPEEPLGDRVNFFTLVFKLILEGKITAYEYRLDGNELFTADNKLDIENLLEKFYIEYKKNGNRYDVDVTNIPSNEILKYYIKESYYLDQRTGDFQTRVTAVCPVLMRSDFGTAYTSYPMFWLNYDEISPYLGQTQVMTSSYNNTSNMSLDDYFVMHQYDGEIYKTSNLRNLSLAESVGGDSASIVAERARIEQQLTDFESHLWNGSSFVEETGSESSAKRAKASSDKAASDKAASSDKASGSSASKVSSGKSASDSSAKSSASSAKTATSDSKTSSKSAAKSSRAARAPKTPKQPKTKSSGSSEHLSVHGR